MILLKFIGNFKDLKKMGFEFDNLFAENNIVYSKGHIFIYKSGRQIKATNFFNLEQIYSFLLPYFKKESFSFESFIEKNTKLDSMFGQTTFVNFYINSDDFITLDKTEYIEEEKKRWQLHSKLHKEESNTGRKPIIPENSWKRISVQISELNIIKELYDNNMIEIVEQ